MSDFTLADLYAQSLDDKTWSNQQRYGVDMSDFSDEKGMFQEITADLLKPTRKETYDDFFGIKTQEKERDYLDAVGKVGYTKDGQATGFAGSTEQNRQVDSLKSAYASEVMDVESEIGDRMSQARMNVANVVADNKSTLLTLKQMEQDDDGDKIICAELHRQGYLDDDIYKVDEEYGKKVLKENPKLIVGYQMWANKVVKLMRKNPIYTSIVWFFAKHWTQDMAYKMGYVDKTTIRGKLVSWVFTQFSYAVFYLYNGQKFIDDYKQFKLALIEERNG